MFFVGFISNVPACLQYVSYLLACLMSTYVSNVVFLVFGALVLVNRLNYLTGSLEVSSVPVSWVGS